MSAEHFEKWKKYAKHAEKKWQKYKTKYLQSKDPKCMRGGGTLSLENLMSKKEGKIFIKDLDGKIRQAVYTSGISVQIIESEDDVREQVITRHNSKGYVFYDSDPGVSMSKNPNYNDLPFDHNQFAALREKYKILFEIIAGHQVTKNPRRRTSTAVERYDESLYIPPNLYNIKVISRNGNTAVEVTPYVSAKRNQMDPKILNNVYFHLEEIKRHKMENLKFMVEKKQDSLKGNKGLEYSYEQAEEYLKSTGDKGYKNMISKIEKFEEELEKWKSEQIVLMPLGNLYGILHKMESGYNFSIGSFFSGYSTKGSGGMMFCNMCYYLKKKGYQVVSAQVPTIYKGAYRSYLNMGFKNNNGKIVMRDINDGLNVCKNRMGKYGQSVTDVIYEKIEN